jgi:ketosteroid isomerase-like protein
MLSLGPRLQVTPVQVLVAGDVALVVNEWTMTGTAPDGAVVERGGKSADVVRRQPDGSWLVLVDRP